MDYISYSTRKIKTYRDLLEYLKKLNKTELDQDVQILIDHDEFLHPQKMVTIVDSEEVKDGQIAISLYY